NAVDVAAGAQAQAADEDSVQAFAGAQAEDAEPDPVQVALHFQAEAEADPAQALRAGDREAQAQAGDIAAAAFGRTPDGDVHAADGEGRNIAEVQAKSVDVAGVADADPD